MKPFLQDNSSPPSQEVPAEMLAELPIGAEYASLILRIWRVPGGEAGMDRTGWRSEVEHIQSGGRWELSSLRELEGFLRDFLRQLGG